MVPPADIAAVVSALVSYERRIRPFVRTELSGWQALAAEISDLELRGAALSAIREKGSNVEAIAVFANLAPRSRRSQALRPMIALQIAIDFLDTLGERPTDDPLADGLSLHRVLADAVSPGTAASEWHGLRPRHEENGYLAALVAACQSGIGALPASEAVLPSLQRAVQRCGEGQSYTHAAARDGAEDLKAWAQLQDAPPGYLWWEVAAGASSPVAAQALIAAAAEPRTTAEEAALIDAAYFPSVGALTVLLDDLVDRDEDLEAGEHNYLSYCTDGDRAANRLALLAERARAAIEPLRHAPGHRAILSGVASFYLSSLSGSGGFAGAVRERLRESLGPTVQLIMVALRLRRHG